MLYFWSDMVLTVHLVKNTGSSRTAGEEVGEKKGISGSDVELMKLQ